MIQRKQAMIVAPQPEAAGESSQAIRAQEACGDCKPDGRRLKRLAAESFDHEIAPIDRKSRPVARFRRII